MEESEVTAYLPKDKKERGDAVLARAGLSASQAINLMYDRLIEDQSAAFLRECTDRPSRADWQRAATIVDGVSSARVSRFDVMSRAGIKADRLRACGLI